MNPPAGQALEGEAAKQALGLSPMETMGALTVRLIHDLSNQLTVLAGNAQVLEMVRDNPERLTKVIERIKTSTTHAGELLDRFARFRQELRFRVAPQSTMACLRSVEALNPLGGQWLVAARGELTGQVALESRWIAFAIWQIALLGGAPNGQVTISEGGFPADWPSPAYVPARLREKRLLRLELAWTGPGPWLDEKEAVKPMNLPLATAYEVFKIIDGWAHYQFLPAGQHRFNAFLPVATTT